MTSSLQRGSSKQAPPFPAASSTTRGPPPTDPAPQEGSRPSDVLINRLNELKRITKSLAAYFERIAASHYQHGKTLLALSSSEVIQSPFPESSLFLPTPVPPGQTGGWADLLVLIREQTRLSGEEHQALAKTVQDNVVSLLKNLRLAVKSHIAELDKAVNSLVDDVVKEREASVQALTHLSTAIAHQESTPLSLPPQEDPLMVGYTARSQMRHQVSAENEALRTTLLWQDKTKTFEAELLESIRFCWTTWETDHAKLLTSAQTRSAALATRVNAVQLDAEWAHFQRLNLLIAAETPTRSLDNIEFPHREHPSTHPRKSGLLQRKKRYVKNYKEAFFVLSPAGYLHEYRSSDTPLDKPYLSLMLPSCTLSPMPPATGSKGGRFKFIIEGRQSPSTGTLRGTIKKQHKQLGRSYSARSWKELHSWWIEIEKFTQGSTSAGAVALEQRQGPGPTAVQRAGLPAAQVAAVTHHDGGSSSNDEMNGSSDEEYAEAATSLGAGKKEAGEVKPGYTETPGIASGTARDLKVKTGIAAQGNVPVAERTATTSKEQISDRALAESPTEPISPSKPLAAPHNPPHHAKEGTSTTIGAPRTQERAASVLVDSTAPSAIPPQQPPAIATHPPKKKRSSWLPFARKG